MKDEEVRLGDLLNPLASIPGKVMLHGDLVSRTWRPEFRDLVPYLRTWAGMTTDGDGACDWQVRNDSIISASQPPRSRRLFLVEPMLSY